MSSPLSIGTEKRKAIVRVTGRVTACELQDWFIKNNHPLIHRLIHLHHHFRR